MKNPFPVYNVPHELPSWVQKGHTQYQNYHAGPSEVAKLVLTQFSLLGYTVEELLSEDAPFAGTITPQTVWDRTNKYSDEFLDEMKAHGKTQIQVSWSCGFSLEAEELQMGILKDFTKKAHDMDMKICAYLSITNIFWKEAFEKEPFLKKWLAVYTDGNPHLYGNSQGRYLACVNQPDWLDYLKNKVGMAIRAGLDHIYFDNVFADCACQVCKDGFANFTKELTGTSYNLPLIVPPQIKGIYNEPDEEEGRAVNQVEAFSRDYLHKQYMAHRLAEALKDIRDHAFKLKSPLPFSANNHLYPFINDVCNLIYSQDTRLPGPEWNNVDILRYLTGDADGWKTVVTNHQAEGSDPRLSMAEAMAFQSYPYGITYKPYNLFYKNNQHLFAEVEPLAKIAVILEWPRRRPRYLDSLALNNIMYKVILLQKWSKEKLRDYDVIILPDLEAVSDDLLSALRDFSENGGTVIATGMSTLHDEFGIPRDNPLERIDKKVSADSILPLEIVDQIRQQIDPQLIEIESNSTVISNLVRKKDGTGYLVHLVHYNPTPVVVIASSYVMQPVTLKSPVSRRTTSVRIDINIPNYKLKTAKLFSPDKASLESPMTIGEDGVLTLPNLDVYSIIEIN